MDNEDALTESELAELRAQLVDAERPKRRGLLPADPQGLQPGAEAGAKDRWKILRKWGWR